MSRSLLIFGLCLPLAVLMGFMLSDPLMSKNMTVIGTMAGLLFLPAVLQLHHSMLIWTSAMYMIVFFVKGQPPVWMLLALTSLTISVISRPLTSVRPKPVWTRGMVNSLIFIGLVMLITGYLRGGFGLKSFGGEVYGGRRYVFIAFAIIGFFALGMQAIPKLRAQRDVRLFVLGPATAVISNIVYTLGPAFYFLYLLFPVDMAMGQAAADMLTGFEGIKRLSGFGPASTALTCFCILKWGFSGILAFQKPWRLLLLITAMVLGILSGFRSHIAFCFLILVIQFFVEGLHRTRYLIGFISVFVIGFALTAAFADNLPIPAQRAISFLPVNIDAVAKADAQNSTEWRLEMWGILVKDIPKYFWLGKGYAIDPTDLFLVNESISRGYENPNQFFIRVGDYHSGPLSIIIPFGIWGVIGFFWVIFNGYRILWNNVRYGDSDLYKVNLFLFSFFSARLVFFLFIFGAFENDLWLFLATIGISLCINGGARSPSQKPSLKFEPKAIRRRQIEMVGV